MVIIHAHPSTPSEGPGMHGLGAGGRAEAAPDGVEAWSPGLSAKSICPTRHHRGIGRAI